MRLDPDNGDVEGLDPARGGESVESGDQWGDAHAEEGLVPGARGGGDVELFDGGFETVGVLGGDVGGDFEDLRGAEDFFGGGYAGRGLEGVEERGGW